jgi:hypothetical protein
VIECGLARRIGEAAAGNERDCADGGPGKRRGYMGPIMLIADAILKGIADSPLEAQLKGAYYYSFATTDKGYLRR